MTTPPTTSSPYKRLYRSRFNRIFAGVCGGFAEYANLDPTLVRLIFILFLFVNFGLAAVLYIIAIFLVPETPFGTAPPPGVVASASRPPPYALEAALLALGGLIITVGVLAFLFNIGISSLNPFAVFNVFTLSFPILIILLGVAIILAILMRPRYRP